MLLIKIYKIYKLQNISIKTFYNLIIRISFLFIYFTSIYYYVVNIIIII